MKRSRLRRQLWSSAVALAALAAGASCGSRTGLFLPDPALDAAIDVDVADVKDAASEDVAADVVEEPVPCIPGTFPLKLATPQLMFVLDRSGSMDFELTSDLTAEDRASSRWGVLESALTEVITPFSDQLAMGARFYPLANQNSFTPDTCAQDPPSGAILPALGNAPAILDVFETTNPRGATPTSTALELAAQELSSSRAVARAMVVATDGAPNCNAALHPATCRCSSSEPGGCNPSAIDGKNCLDDDRTVQTIATIFGAQKIPVYVIGIGATGSFASTLDAMALAGGRARSGSPRYFAADTPAALTGAFAEIRDKVAKCSYITLSSPTDPDAIAIAVDGTSVPRDPAHLEGWDWLDQAFGHLQLFGDACAAATASNVTATVSCEAPDD